MARILIVDDHPLIADGIKAMLADYKDLQVAGICKSGRDVIGFIEKNQIDLVLLDLNLPDIDGLELCERIRHLDRDIPIIILTSINESTIISQALTRGASGYLLKDMEQRELIDAIDQVMDGKRYVSRSANSKLLEQFGSVKAVSAQSIIITRREKEILQLLSEGLNGPQIAQRLFISPYTVETHRKNLMQKVQAGTTQLLIRKAIALRLL